MLDVRIAGKEPTAKKPHVKRGAKYNDKNPEAGFGANRSKTCTKRHKITSIFCIAK
jgi:hypothetical protein